ncbi:RNA polymerase sigma factor SigJ [Streptosporangium sp. NBC_01755]|uniref:RNA polymerase sigma factor SigJ n=1 Tax=unclassified Streptosporangium TaxID=2632669 RepID=UPI002DD99C27|nr:MULTISPECIES: RNA polymerase sigma factor SigJ [unclassified Streptosporangium]WSA29388.1 RNA polymerase sigma factor SigJ [Streptosporangium sp. NBC_01810]WSC99168.1 RNA polymerase sigma factor SigJ [Streptosporangium sp. NBC_01755]
MTEEEWAEHRPAVFGAAYRLLGSVGDAEDVAQDVWLRAAGADLSGVENPRAWLVTVAARRSYDILRSARVRRETYVGPWLPEPLLTGPDAAEPVLVDESVSMAMLVVMDRLTPPERVAFVLHDVFEVPFDRIARVLGVTPAAGRQLASRARRRVAATKQQPRASRPERERVLAAFRAAYEASDLKALVELLHPDAVYVTDGGGKVFAARKVISGGERIATVLSRVAGRWGLFPLVPREVGGELALVAYRDKRIVLVDTFDVAADGRILAIRRVLNPDKLSYIDPAR